jgi:hypothetical protein
MNCRSFNRWTSKYLSSPGATTHLHHCKRCASVTRTTAPALSVLNRCTIWIGQYDIRVRPSPPGMSTVDFSYLKQFHGTFCSCGRKSICQLLPPTFNQDLLEDPEKAMNLPVAPKSPWSSRTQHTVFFMPAIRMAIPEISQAWLTKHDSTTIKITSSFFCEMTYNGTVPPVVSFF